MDVDEAPETLVKVGEASQDVAAGLNKLLTPVADSAPEITAVIGKCFALSSALRDLAKTIEELLQISRYRRVDAPIYDVAYSLDYTFKDVHAIVGQGFAEGQRRGVSQTTSYRRVWRDINAHFQAESGNRLDRRLEYCRACLQELTIILLEGSPRDPTGFNSLVGRIASLVDVQAPRFHNRIDWPDEFVPPQSALSKPPSFERSRPREGQAGGARNPRPEHGDPRPPMEPYWDPRHPHRPPFAPEPPLSPIFSDAYSNDSSEAHNMAHGFVAAHWVSKVFERLPPSTALPEVGQNSSCVGDDNPEAIDRLERDYVKLRRIPFEGGKMTVELWLRPKDNRARILCVTPRQSPSQNEACLLLTTLDVHRDGPFLKLKPVDRSARPGPTWAYLRFPSYENLVIFFCIFLALRSQDSSHPINKFNDDKLHREEEIFKCPIMDDHFEHNLRLYKDRDSGGIRLLASVLGGHMKKSTPVWTAFITYQIHHPTWMRRAGSKVVRLADLQRYVFTDEYTPQITTGGEHEIAFKRSRDCDDFIEAVEEVVDAE